MSDPDTLFDDMIPDVVAALDAVGQKIVAAKQADLGVQAQVTRGPRGGKIVQRSRSGESPLKQTGKLQAGVVHDVAVSGVDVALTVDDVQPYAKPLQGNKLNRVVLSDVPDRFADQVLDAVADAIEGNTNP